MGEGQPLEHINRSTYNCINTLTYSLLDGGMETVRLITLFTKFSPFHNDLIWLVFEKCFRFSLKEVQYVRVRTRM